MAGRVRHPIDVKALERYIEQHVPEIKTPLDVKQFGFGQSNPTYQLTSPDGQRYVMRKKPPGKLISKTAHKVDREYRIIHALEHTDVPVPRAYCLCEDDDGVVGTPFYIMEFLDGRIIEDPAMPGVSARERTALWRAAVETLARFHSVDFRAVGLAKYGKTEGFYGRQLQTWRTICDAQASAVDADSGKPVGKLPHFDELLAYFSDAGRQPADRGTLIHGDYKIDNVVFHKTEPRVIGILDWEMSTIGHPLSDLANLMGPFDNAKVKGMFSDSKAFLPGATPGLPDQETVMGWYAAAAGWDPRPEMNWARAFSTFRLAAICQGIAARVATRQASSESAVKHASSMVPLANYAWQLVQEENETKGVSKPKL
ncbi:acyl-CoA dehydrogenase family member 11 [Microdochium nivale]|nr:acyl-CoA dehydrogenase family member 11 [Microdochium nivale]